MDVTSGGTTVVIADEQRLFAEAIAEAVAREADLTVLDHHPRTGLQAVEAFAKHRPDVIVLYYWLPGMNGPAATRQILALDPSANVILLGWLCGPLQLHEARESGARAFLPKTSSFEEVADAIRVLHRTARPAPPPRGKPLLTHREMEVLQLFCEGRGRDEVAERLGIREGTVKNHVHNILTKSGARTMLEAVNMARNQGIVR